ncbi:TetR/AcrR family transcriptional regulator [Pyruvatibacter mobilis]|uniref:TetR/AcrR family transcriptional regulator n=1 Tax=Pyruvatibacter mobilis TaxID=1712261 RepID=UPI003BB0B7CD
MPRPTLKKQRREQILDAFEQCVARYGLAGATLERVSEEADLARPLIRHNVGNRDDLVAAFMDRFFERSTEVMTSLREHLPARDKAQALINWLFQPGASDPRLVLVSSALIMAAAYEPALARQMRSWMDEFTGLFEDALKADFPRTDEQQLHMVATGLCGIYLNYESMTPLGPVSDLRTSSHDAALALLGTLGSS